MPKKGGSIMAIITRIKRIISANINSLIEKAEDPESLLKELIREMDDNIIKLRNEIIRSIAAEKRLARQVEDVRKKIQTWQENSEKAVRDENDELARKALGRKLAEDRKLPDLIAQHNRALESGKTLKDQLRLLEDKVQDARRRKEILIARKRSAQAHQSMLNVTQNFAAAARKSDALLAEAHLLTPGAFDTLEDEVLRLETEAEAMREVMSQEPSLDEVFERSKADEAIERQLQELKKKVLRG
jgi:phage shock protein A